MVIMGAVVLTFLSDSYTGRQGYSTDNNIDTYNS